MADGNLCTVVARPNPFDSDTVFAEVGAGQTIAQMLGEGVTHACHVAVGGYAVPEELWGRVRPKAGQTIHVTVYPQGGGGGSKILRVVALVVVAVASFYTVGAVGAIYGSAMGALAGAAVSIVGGLLINALIPPPSAKGPATSDPFKQLASLTGTSNQAGPYGVVPCVVGTCRFFPPHAALPYTEISGNDQYLRMLLDLGTGDLDISDIQIGGTAISNYTDVQYEISTNPSLFTQDIYELSVGTPVSNAGDTDTRTTQGASTEISLDIIFANGYYGVNNNGGTVSGDTSFTISYRPTGSTSWISATTAANLTTTGGLAVSGGGFSLHGGFKQTLRTGVRWTVPSGQYDVQVTRGSTNFPGAAANATQSAAIWSVLRSISPQLPSTTGTLKLAVRIKASDQLQGVVQNLSVLAAQKIPSYDPVARAWSANAECTNPAWIAAWLMTRCPAVMRRLADSRLNLQDFAAWAADCTAKNYTIGFVMDSARAFSDVLRDVYAAGRASFGVRNGLYSAVRDVAQTVPVQMFTPANSWNFSYGRIFTDLPHALRVTFTNPEATWQKDVVTVYAAGYSAATATRFEQLDLSMVTDPGAAWLLGSYHLAVVYGRPNTYTFESDVEHIVCERGDLIHVAHDIIGWGYAWGRVKSNSGTTLVVDGPVTLQAGSSYQVRIRASNGTESIVAITNAPGTTDTLTLAGGITGNPGDLFLVGVVQTDISKLIVKAVEPSADLSARITAVDYSTDVVNADTATPPTFVSGITGTAWCAPPDPPVVNIRPGNSSADDAGVVGPSHGVSANPGGGIYRLPIYGGPNGRRVMVN